MWRNLSIALVLPSVACAQTAAPSPQAASAPDAALTSGTPGVSLPEPATCPVGPQTPAPFPAFAQPLAQCIGAVPEGVGAKAGGDQVDAALAFRASPQAAPQVYHDGDWAPVWQGIQGTGHVAADLLIAHSAAGTAPLSVQVVRQVWFDCNYHTETAPFTMAFVPSPKAGWLMPLKPLNTIVNMPISLSCGRWVRLQTLFRLPGDDHWHRAGCTVHLYAAQPLEDP